MDLQELQHRFEYHPPKDAVTAARHADMRELCVSLAADLNAMLPDGREKSLAITNLEQVMFWGNAAIARTAASTAQD